jgi:lipoprotein-releasing system ATP-binding protein
MPTATATTVSTALAVRGVSHRFTQGTRSVEVLHHVDLTVMAGECVAIVGRSGSGKSTMLYVAAGLTTPSAGEVLVGGRSLAGLSGTARASLRRRTVGVVFQFFHLLAHLPVVDNVAFPLVLDGSTKATARAHADEILAAIGIGHLRDRRPADLSGGEMQRVAIARALVSEPQVVLADEPTGNLDAASSEPVLDLLVDQTRERGAALVLVTHDDAVAARADRTLRLEDGKLVDAERSSGP